MTKRISQANTVVVPGPAVHAVEGQVVATKVAAPVAAEAADKPEVLAKVEAPAAAEPVIALVAPAPLAMVAGQDTMTPAPTTTDSTTTTTTTTASDDTMSGDKDYTPYIVGGVLLAGGILAVALSSGGDDDDTPAPTPPPTPTPTNTVTFSSAATASIAENAAATTTVIDVNAAGTQTGAITYTLGGTDAALFNIDAATGIVTLKTSANFEAKSSYAITVTAASAGTPAATATQAIAVTVTNVNEFPTFANGNGSGTVAENAPVATVIFDANATDVDAGSAITYTLSGQDAALLNINPTTGEVTLKAPADFETKATYTFNVVASDGVTGSTAATQAVTVAVTNVNDSPTFAAATATGTVAENAAVTTVIFDANATDADAGSAITYTLSGQDAALLNINATTGEVTLKASADFETKATYTFNVVASDGVTGSTAATQAVTVNVTDVNEGGPVGVTTSLDSATGAVSGQGTGGAAQATTFTDSAGIGNISTINNFGSDDKVVFSGTTSVSFSSIDNDLTIQFTNAAGTVESRITINNVVSPDAIITSETTANAALNTFYGTQGVDFFQFA